MKFCIDTAFPYRESSRISIPVRSVAKFGVKRVLLFHSDWQVAYSCQNTDFLKASISNHSYITTIFDGRGVYAIIFLCASVPIWTYYNPLSKPCPNLLAYRIATRLNIHLCRVSVCHFEIELYLSDRSHRPIGNLCK